MFLSDWREFPSAPCLAGGEKNLIQFASRCYWNRTRSWHSSELVSFLVGLRTYQHPVNSNKLKLRNYGIIAICGSDIAVLANTCAPSWRFHLHVHKLLIGLGCELEWSAPRFVVIVSGLHERSWTQRSFVLPNTHKSSSSLISILNIALFIVNSVTS